MLAASLGLFAAKKEKPLPEKVLYIEYRHMGSKNNLEQSVQIALVTEVIAPYYEGFGYQRAGKQGKDLIVIVSTRNFKQEILGYSASLFVQGDPTPSTLFMSFDYQIDYYSPLGIHYKSLTGSFSDIYKNNVFDRIPKLRVPELSMIAVRPMIIQKDIAISETRDMRTLGIGLPMPKKKSKISSYWLEIAPDNTNGKHLANVIFDVEDFFAAELKKIAQRTYIIDEADIILKVKLLSYREVEEYRDFKVKNNQGGYDDKRVNGVHAYLGYQLDVLIPTGWAMPNNTYICGLIANADGWEELPVLDYNIIQNFPEISALDFTSFLEFGYQNRSLRMAANPDANNFLWFGYIGELPHNPKKPILEFIDIKDGMLGVSETFEAVTRLSQQILDENYLAPRAPYEISKLVPPKVLQKELPPLPALVKDQFETTREFEKRVAQAQNLRQQEVNAAKEEFAQQVRDRNTMVEALERHQQADLAMIAKELQFKKQNLSFVYPELVGYAFYHVLGQPKLRNLQYDADTQTIHGVIYSERSAYTLGFTQTLPAKQAKEYIAKQSRIIPVLTYKVQADITEKSISNQQLQLIKLCTYLDGNHYPAELSNENYQPNQITFQIQEKKVAWSADGQVDFTLQDPLLVDRMVVESMRVSDRNRVVNNDLIELIEKAPQAPIDNKKWLFIIGIENYQNTYPISYSLESADLFEKAAVKLLGINTKDNHVYKLRDNQATAASIKDKLSLMLDRVEEGDQIYFYYSGHGMASKPPTDEHSVEYDPYLIPVDNNPNLIYKYPEMKAVSIYQQLTASKAAKVVCIVEACFSGMSDFGSLVPSGDLAAGYFREKLPAIDKNKMVLLSATQSGQPARAYEEKGNRLFTYHLIKSMLNTKNVNPSAQELYNLYANDVKRISSAQGDAYVQNPGISGNANLSIK